MGDEAGGDDGEEGRGGWEAFGSLFGDPDQFLEQVLTTAGPVAIRMAIRLNLIVDHPTFLNSALQKIIVLVLNKFTTFLVV